MDGIKHIGTRSDSQSGVGTSRDPHRIVTDLNNKNIFMSSGLYGPIVPKQDAERLVGLFKKAGAKVLLYWQNSGHELVMEEVKRAKDWLLHYFPSPV